MSAHRHFTANESPTRASGAGAAPAFSAQAIGNPIYVFDHGDFEVSVLSDGHLLLPTALLAAGAPSATRTSVLAEGGLSGAEYEPAANVTLIRRGADLILFDTGGVGYQPQAGRLSQNLAVAGIDALSITKVVFTHGHPDHIWGTVLDDGALRFPNAAYYSGATEWDFWMSDDIWNRLPSSQHPFATGARRQYAAVRDRVTMLRTGNDVVSGIRVIDTPGHTPGHISFEVSGGDGLIIVGDTITAPSVYFEHPEWKFGFDSDHETAISSRKTLLDRAANDRTKLLGYHWPYPGVGYAEQNGGAYKYIPVEEQSLLLRPSS
jgi:glyoxylase-like metal-dependent hydrolase (beta-lactamase superfamily II)